MDIIPKLLKPIAEKAEREVFGPKLDDLPFSIGPLQYAGLGDFRPQIPKILPDVLSFKPMPPTMDIRPVFNLITGEVEDYEDIPISTLSTDNPDLVRPITDIDNYLAGLSSTNISPASDQDLSQYLAALDTGTNLLTTPFTDEVTKDEVTLDPLPEMPDIEASEVYRAKKVEEDKDEVTLKAKLDTWDVSRFNDEIPNPAIKFDFKCDEFQLRAIHRLENHEMVFVSAPTSAGKTLVAQYALALSERKKMRAIYTSPIKALSNQKFRDFKRQFKDVGILTGDVTLNRSASVLIMTTEILRKMLFNGADLLRDVSVVVFDECHYISDGERGVVWEESIILMPPHINMVFLSATIPNDVEIASWIARTKERPVWIERHEERPVPLHHCVYAAGKFEIIRNPKQEFRTEKYFDIKDHFDDAMWNKKGRNNPLFTPRFWTTVLETFKKQKLLPCLMFSFSQKNCVNFADLSSKVALISEEQKRHVRTFFNRSMSKLKPIDRKLPQVQHTLSLLECGIGVHHGGMLPILKECVEILLADGYVQVLFCTSTFAMGINVPARSCAFTSLTKFNGKEMVDLTPTEYVQMSGRAGRRGLDEQGYAILLCSNDFPSEEFLRKTFGGKVETLSSKFYVRYNMVLSLSRSGHMTMVDFLKQSLSANNIESKTPEKKKKLEELDQKIKSDKTISCIHKANIPEFIYESVTDIEDIGNVCNVYSELIYRLESITRKIRSDVGQIFTDAIERGQIIFTSACSTDYAIFQGKHEKKFKILQFDGSNHIIHADKIIAVFPKIVKNIAIFDKEINIDPKPIPFSSLFKKNDLHFMHYSREHLILFEALSQHPCFTCNQRSIHYPISAMNTDHIRSRKVLLGEIENDSLSYLSLIEPKVKLLKNMEYLNGDGVITMKGRVSIDITSGSELIATQLLYINFFNDLDPASIASLCSVLVAQRAGGDDRFKAPIPVHLEDKLDFIIDIARDIENEIKANNDEYDEDFLEEKINPAAMLPVYNWAINKELCDVMKVSNGIPEGSLVRIISMTTELLKGLSSGSMKIGNTKLVDLFDAAIEAIKRDVMFSSSLYFD